MLLLLSGCLLFPSGSRAKAMEQSAPSLSTVWVHSAPEYDAVVATIYASALDEILHQSTRLDPKTPWAVVSDADETLIDNSLYQVETGGHYTPESWAVWEEQGRAVATPGAVSFVAAIHDAGGRMAFVTNRKNHPAALSLLQSQGLWAEGDVLCVRTESSDKEARRQSILQGGSLCGWEGQPVSVLAYLGDQRGDFPDQQDSTTSPWGSTWFMLPNPMYGGWAR